MKTQEIQAPNKTPKKVFLAGSIEMGNATNWQKEIEDHLADEEGIILNPRRDEWDESWEQSIKNKQFRQQVEWELYGLDNASVIVMYFEPNTLLDSYRHSIDPFSSCFNKIII